jgi:hypothetical protein
VPANHRLGLDDRDYPQDRREESLKPHKQQAIRISQLYAPGCFAPQNDELLAEEKVLGFEPGARAEKRTQDRHKLPQEIDHPTTTYHIRPQASPRIEFSVATRVLRDDANV